MRPLLDLVVNEEGAVAVLQGGVSVEDGVVGLHYSGGDLRCRVDGEGKFRFLAVLH